MDRVSVRKSLSALSLALSLAAAAIAPASAQQVGTVTGTVTDSGNRQPIAGAQVYLPGLQLGALSNAQGRFLIVNVPVGQREIRAELIGRTTASQTVNVQAGQAAQVNFMLESRAISLEGVVVTGVAAATPRTQLAFTVEQVRVNQALAATSLNAGSMIQGRMAGAKIIMANAQPGEAPSIQLRGPKSITGSQDPLVIVDGVISRGSIADIDPNDIESIEVVKGAAAASLYGSRAQAGVIEITTKRGAGLSQGRTEFTLRNTWQRNAIEHVMPMTFSHGYRMNAAGTAFVDRNGRDIVLPADESAFLLDDGGNGTDQYRAFKNRAYPASIFTGNPYRQLMQPNDAYSTYFSVSSNQGDTQYRISGRYQRDKGIVAYHEGAKQMNFRANVDQRLGDKLNFALSSYLSNLRQDVAVGTDGGGLFGAIDEHSPASDYLKLDPITGKPQLIGDPIGRSRNPLYVLAQDTDDRETQRVMVALDAGYRPFSWLDVDANFSFDRSDVQQTSIQPAGLERIDNTPELGRMQVDQVLRRDINASITASIAHNFGDLTTRTRLRLLEENSLSRQHRAGASNFAVSGVPRLALLTGTAGIDSREQKIVSEGFFAITALTYKDRYVVDLLGRRDGSSLFGAEERWQNYYRMSAAWRMAAESWWPFSVISEFKPRYSIGTAGGRPGFNYQYQTYAVEQGRIVPKILGNNFLKPELSTEQEYGVDAVVADRLRIQANYVKSKVEDQLLEVPNSASLGFVSQWQNAGTVESTTWEGVFEMSFVERADLLWTGRLNIDRTTQQITHLGVPAYELINERARIIIKEGESLGTFYGFRWATDCAVDLPQGTDCSLFRLNDDGLLVYVGAGNDYRDGKAKRLWGTSGNVTSTAGRTTYSWGMPIRSIFEKGFTRIGAAQPDLNVSFAQDITYKKLGVNVLFDAEFGGQIMNQSRQWGSRTSVASIDQRNKPTELEKPIVYYGPVFLYAGNIRNDFFVERADFIKFRELSIHYTLNEQDLPSFLRMSRATINLTGRNLHTFTSYVGPDPEVGKTGATTGAIGGGSTTGGRIEDGRSFGGSAAVGRIDEYFYPNYRSLGIDVELVF
jgi:TonB-linked SusC/RagA family outer membrane protein